MERATRPGAGEDFESRQQRTRAETAWNDVLRRIGRRYAHCEFANFQADLPEQKRVLCAIQLYLEAWEENRAQGRGMLLHGPVGTGKDHLAVAAMRVVATKFLGVTHWIDGQFFYATMRDVIGSDSSESDAIKPFTTPDVLLISDPLPAANDKAVSDFQQSALWRIIDRRYRDWKPTWVTMNAKDATEVAAKIGVQITERLGHGALICFCDWPSARKPSQVLK